MSRKIIPEHLSNQEDYESPIESSGFLSYMTFLWAYPFITKTNKTKGSISLDDIPKLGYTEQAKTYESRFSDEFTKDKSKKLKNKDFFFWSVIKVIKWPLLVSCMLELIFHTCKLLIVFLLSKLLESLADPTQGPGDAFKYASGMFIAVIGTAFAANHSVLSSERATIFLNLGSYL
jgi:hypothetical protein